jgi:hypothetical protein
VTKRSISDLLEDISLDLGQMAREASWNRMLALDSASMLQDTYLDQSLQMGLMQSDLEFALDDLRREMTDEFQRQLDLLKASQLPPIEAEVRELMARARDNEQHQLYEEALEDLLRAEEKQPYDYRLQDWLGSLYLQHFNDPSTALSHFDRAVRYATPRSKKAGAWELLSRSRCKIALGDLQGAYEDTSEAVSLDSMRPQVLYEHAAHAALIHKSDEALSTLERAIQYAPVYWLTAAQDPRFQGLGDSLPALLERMHAQMSRDLETFLAQGQELESVVADWEIAARTFAPALYDDLWLPVAEARAALHEGTYPRQVKALDSIRQGLPKLIGWIDKQLAAAIAKTEKDLAEILSQKSGAENDARSRFSDALGASLGLLGYAVVVVAAILLFRWSIDFVRLEDLFDLFLDLFKLGGISIAGFMAYWAVPNVIKQFRQIAEHASSRERLLESSKRAANEASSTERRLGTLQAQRDSLRLYIQRSSSPKP